MRLPEWALTSTARVQRQVQGEPDRLNQRALTWQIEDAPRKCGNMPISSQGVRRAELLGIKATREIYLPAVQLDALTTRLLVDGETYLVRDVRAWDGYTVVLAEEV